MPSAFAVSYHLGVHTHRLSLLIDFHGYDQLTLSFDASADARFMESLRPHLEHAGGDWVRLTNFGLALSLREQAEMWGYFLVDEEDTVGDVYQLFGPDLESIPPTVLVQPAGFGGGETTMLVWDVAQAILHAGLDTAGVASLLIEAAKTARRLRNRGSREAVAEWAKTGVPPARLVEMVREAKFWEIEEFTGRFGTDEIRSGELLRFAGFKFLPYDGVAGNGIWVNEVYEDPIQVEPSPVTIDYADAIVLAKILDYMAAYFSLSEDPTVLARLARQFKKDVSSPPLTGPSDRVSPVSATGHMRDRLDAAIDASSGQMKPKK